MDFETRGVGPVKIPEGQRIVLEHATLRGEDFSGRKLLQFLAIGSRFESCRFDRMRIQDATWGFGFGEQSEYQNCSFDGTRMRFHPGGNYRFVGCSFRNVDLRDWFCLNGELVDCVFTGRLKKAVFHGKVPQEDRLAVGRVHNEFRGNDFSGTNLIDVAFRSGIDLSLQRLPSGPQYLYLPDAQTAVQAARLEAIGRQDLELRRRAMSLIRTLTDELADGQTQLLLRTDDYSVLGRDASDAVFKILRQFASDAPQ